MTGVAALPPGIDAQTVYRSVFAAYPDALIVVDAAGSIVLSNPPAERMLGYGPDELVGLNVDALVPDAIRPRHADYRGAYAKAPRSRPMGTQMDLVARRKDGSMVMVEIALSPLHAPSSTNDQGLPLVVASIRDIGTYPRVRQALLRARYSEHLAQFARTAVDVRDPQSLLAQVTPLAASALELDAAIVYLLEPDRREFRVASSTGLDETRAVGARIANQPDAFPGLLLQRAGPALLGPGQVALPPALVRQGLDCGAALPLVDRGRNFGVLAVLSRRTQPFGEDEMRFLDALCGLLATCLQRAQGEEALNHAQRLESVGQLTGGITHDFNNLLTVIQGNLQFLEDVPALANDADGRRMVDAATRATRRAAELTGKLLAFSRRQMLQPQPVDIGPLVVSLADMLRRTLDQRVRIELEIELDCPAVLADPVQLESAMLNVAINARDAMPEGGRIVFRVAACDEPVPDLAPEQSARRFVAVAISDTGSGMSEEVRERVFEPFFTTKGAGRGTGLGMSTVHGFVKQSRGSVAIASAPGAGTTVTLYLPALAANARASLDEAAPSRLHPGLRVLLVEDDAAVRDIAAGFLAGFGCVVTSCSTGEDALSALDHGPAFDLLMTDIALGPGLRGTDVAARAQQRQPGLAVLLVSGFSQELVDADQSAPLDWELLPKPYSRHELERALSSAVAGSPA